MMLLLKPVECEMIVLTGDNFSAILDLYSNTYTEKYFSADRVNNLKQEPLHFHNADACQWTKPSILQVQDVDFTTWARLSVFCHFHFPQIFFIRSSNKPSSSIQLSATGRLLDITYMCYVFRTPLFPAQLLLARQSDLSVTSIPQSVSRWRHNEYSWCSHPLHFVQALHTPVVKVRLVVWRSDLTGQGVISMLNADAIHNFKWG